MMMFTLTRIRQNAPPAEVVAAQTEGPVTTCNVAFVHGHVDGDESVAGGLGPEAHSVETLTGSALDTLPDP
jgi:hypothetical protein